MQHKEEFMENSILDKAQSWSKNPYFDLSDRNEILQLIESNNEDELTDRFYKDLEFGTAGLRSIMGMGSNRINKYTIRKATQAMVNTLFAKGKSKIICVSYDSRNNSEFYAKEVCAVLAGNGIKAFIYNTLTPVPMLSYAVRYHKAGAGIMITASHNPIEYNGFKAFWSDGSQITPPIDTEIISEYQNLFDWNKIKYMDFNHALDKGLIEFNAKEVEENYYLAIKNRILNKTLIEEKGELLKVVYTPIHGTGKVPCLKLAAELGFKNFAIVKKQAEPDGNFPTVKSPNPEYPEALTLAVEQMLQTQSDIVLGTDPDTDRLGVAVNHNDEVQFLTGNQIGAIFLYYLLEQKKENNLLSKKTLLLKSIVTSDIQTDMAKYYGVTIENTLTGFKWMAKKIKDREDNRVDFDFLFANEESYGYLGHSEVRDKDGVCAVIQMCEVALYFKDQGKNLIQVLDEIYEKFGLHYDDVLSLNFYGKAGSEKIIRIMDKLRSKELKEILGEKLLSISDYKTLVKYDLVNKSEESFEFEPSNLLCLQFNNGTKFFVRPSGTEPKIKFYFMLKSTKGPLDERKELSKEKIIKLHSFIKNYCEKA